MSRFLFTLILLSAFTLPATAKDFRDRYTEASLDTVTNYMVNNKLLNLETRQNYLDYLRITECGIYDSVKDSQFKQQEIQSALQKKFSQPATGDGTLYVKVQSAFYISDYNFDTQSLNLHDRSKMKRANNITLINWDTPLCDKSSSRGLSLPAYYTSLLNVPISIYRIPVKKEIAEQLITKLDQVAGVNPPLYILYGTLYVQIDAATPIFGDTNYVKMATLHGQLNVLDLYMDQERKILLKRLNYEENY